MAERVVLMGGLLSLEKFAVFSVLYENNSVR